MGFLRQILGVLRRSCGGLCKEIIFFVDMIFDYRLPILDIDKFSFTVKLVGKIMSLLGCVVTHLSMLLSMVSLVVASSLGGKSCLPM